MKVILMQKVERLGEAGQQVEVADGYARNFLLPKHMAVLATPGRVKSLVQLKAQSRNKEESARREAEGLAARLATVQVTMRRRAGEAEAAQPGEPATADTATTDAPEAAARPVTPPARLFGSVTAQDISEALVGQGLKVDKKHVLLAEPIKTLGVHRVPVRLHAEVTAEVSVTVERETS
jgi:large subunit ribosomal protein L9